MAPKNTRSRRGCGRIDDLDVVEALGQILTIVGTCVAHGINPRAYLHLVTKMLVYGWPQSRLRELLPDRLAVKHPQLLLRDDDISNYFPEIEKVARIPASLTL